MEAVPTQTPTATTNPVVSVQPGSLPIPAAYAQLGAVTGYKPLSADQLRLFIVALTGRGKTTFVSSDRNSFILDYENGANAIPTGIAGRLNVRDINTHTSILNRLIEDGKANRRVYSRIVIDTIEGLIDLIGAKFALEQGLEHFSEYGSKGAGYGIVRNRLWNDITALESAGYAWTIVGHLTEKTVIVNKTEVTVCRPVVSNSFADLIFRNADIFAQVARVTTVRKKKVKQLINGQTVEITLEGQDELSNNYFLQAASIPGESALDQAKARGVPTLKVNIPIDTDGWNNFSKAYTEAVQTQQSKLTAK